MDDLNKSKEYAVSRVEDLKTSLLYKDGYFTFNTEVLTVLFQNAFLAGSSHGVRWANEQVKLKLSPRFPSLPNK